MQDAQNMLKYGTIIDALCYKQAQSIEIVTVGSKCVYSTCLGSARLKIQKPLIYLGTMIFK